MTNPPQFPPPGSQPPFRPRPSPGPGPWQPHPAGPPPQGPPPQGYRQPFPYSPSPSPEEQKSGPRSRWFVIALVVLVVLIIGGVVMAISGMTRFAPPAEEMVAIEGPTPVNFPEGDTYWVYVPQAESAVAHCEVTFTDGTPVPGTTSSTTYTVQYQGSPYTSINVLPSVKQDPSLSGVSFVVSCDTPNAVAGPGPNTAALGLGIGGIVLASLCFVGAVGAVVIRTWIRVLGNRSSLPRRLLQR